VANVAGVLSDGIVIPFPEGPEQIDITIWLGRTLLVGEAKCMLYPGSAYEDYQYHETIQKAAKQASRKATRVRNNLPLVRELIQKYTSDVPSLERVLPIVLVNTSLGVGVPVNDVPVVDLRLLCSYFDPGYIDHFVRVEADGSRSSGARETFYATREEAEEHLSPYLDTPPQLRNYFKFLTRTIHPYPSLTASEKPMASAHFEVALPVPSATFEVSEGLPNEG
jgi:hypothetical protein